jgi:iron-sulfur cluster assembly accessory protein
MVYSDLGAIVLTQAIEHIYGMRIDSLLDQRLFGPLGMVSTRYLPPASWAPRIAPTENDPWRGRILLGEVHDENAARLDGVSGHAGIFSNARDLLAFADWLMSGVHVEGARPPTGAPEPPAALAAFIRRQGIPPGSSRALGWDTPSAMSSAGTRLDSTSFGHTGFTGTSIWIDPTRGLAIVLTDKAADEVRKFIAAEKVSADTAGLRVSVLPGGCSGFKYSLNIEEAPLADDLVMPLSGIRLFVDGFSAQYLSGVTIDYVSSMQGSGFTFSNPNATGGCGCGSSFTA